MCLLGGHSLCSVSNELSLAVQGTLYKYFLTIKGISETGGGDGEFGGRWEKTMPRGCQDSICTAATSHEIYWLLNIQQQGVSSLSMFFQKGNTVHMFGRLLTYVYYSGDDLQGTARLNWIM